MPNEKPLLTLYKGLKANNYDVPDDYDSFERTLTTGGDGGAKYAAQSRHDLYNALKSQNYDVPDSYEHFYSTLFEPVSKTASRAKGGAAAQQQHTGQSAGGQQAQRAAAPKPQQQGMSAAERAAFINNAQGLVDKSAAGIRRTKNQMDYAKGNAGLRVKPVHLGQNSKVVARNADGTLAQQRPVLDMAPQEQPGQTYVTESGNEFDNRAEADTEQNNIDQFKSEQNQVRLWNNEIGKSMSLDDAYAERDRLNKLLEQRGKELDAENEGKWWRDLPRGGGAGVSTVNALDNNGRTNDTEYLQLLAAAKKNDERIRDLEAAKKEKTGTFLGGLWRGFRDYAFDLSNWDNGYRDLLTTSAMLRAKTGAAQTPREKEAERSMLMDTSKAGIAAQKAEEELGNGYRFMRTAAQSLPFALQFVAGNGMMNALGRGGEALGVKAARQIAIKQGANNMMRNIGRTFLKNTGVMFGDLAASAALSNTIQGAQTLSDIGNRYVGEVTYDPQTDDYKIEGGKSLGRAIYEGEANSIIENYTERLGEHLHLGKWANSALNKVGLGKVSDWFTKVGKTDFMKGVNHYLEMGGFNGYPQEVMEEEIGIPLHAIFDGGNKMSDLIDGRQQLDIVGGMLFSMAGMGAASMTMQGGHKAAMAIQYHQDQHKLGNADKIASFRLTADKWAPIKEEIDGTTNQDFGETMKKVFNRQDLDDIEKQAVWDYAQRLITMRGHNMGQEAATRNGMTDKETNAANESYTQGYNTTDATAMNDARNALAMAQQKLDEAFGSQHVDAQQVLDDTDEGGNPSYDDNTRKAAQDVVNAQQAYEGMLQRVRDDIDDEVQQTSAIYDSRTNDQGVIQGATLKQQNADGTDRKVYITSGNVVMSDDGKSVDTEKSSQSVVVVDENGKVQMVSPEEIFSLDAPLDGAQAKQQAIDAIQQSKAQEAADKIDGKVDLTPGNTYTFNDYNGQQVQATIVADEQTGQVQNADGTVNVSINGQVTHMAPDMLQQMVDSANMQRTQQEGQQAQEEEQQAESEEAQGDAAAQQQPTQQEGDQGILEQGGTVVPEGGNVVDLTQEGDNGGTVVPTQEEQEPHQWQVDDTFTIDNGGVPVRGQVTGVGEDGVEIYTEQPINGKKMQVVAPDVLQGMTTEINGEAGYQPTNSPDSSDSNDSQQQGVEAEAEPQPTQQNSDDGVNGSNGVNAEQHTQEQPQEQPQQPTQRAIDRIPSQEVNDGKGHVRTVHNWEQAEPGDTYDALTEIYHGNADRVKNGVTKRIDKIDKAIKGVQKQMDAIDNSDDFDAVAAQAEQYNQLQQQKDELQKQKEYWQNVRNVPGERTRAQVEAQRAEADRKAKEERERFLAEQKKAEEEAQRKADEERQRQEDEEAQQVKFNEGEEPEGATQTPSPAEQRRHELGKAKTVKDLQKQAEKVYGKEAVSDMEPRTVEELVASWLSPHSLNFEGKTVGGVQQRGVSQELGIKSRGIGRNSETAAINYWLAPTGQGVSVDQAAHDIWENRPTSLDNVDVQEVKDSLINLLHTSSRPSDISSLILRNRIDEAEQQLATEEQYEQEAMEREAWERQQKVNTYCDMLTATMDDWLVTPEIEDAINAEIIDETYEDMMIELGKDDDLIDALEQINNNDNEQRNNEGANAGSKQVGEEPQRSTVEGGATQGEVTLHEEETHKPGSGEGTTQPQGRAAGQKRTGDDVPDGSVSVQEEPQEVDNSNNNLGATSSTEKMDSERQAVNTEPTEKQKEAGNYKKGHIKVDGYDITIENPKGSTRSGKDANGKEWSVPMHYDYGYIKGTKGTDGDHIDVYLSDNPTSGNVYVVDQIDQKTGEFDEHKVMYGFPSKEAAIDAYKSQYEKGWKVGKVTEVSREDFKKWVESSTRKTKPFSEYKSVKANEGNDDAVQQQPTQHYTVEPYEYTTKRGRVLNMQLVKFDRRLTSWEKKQFAPIVKEDKGWWSKDEQGYLMRTEEGAKKLGDAYENDGADKGATNTPKSEETQKAQEVETPALKESTVYKNNLAGGEAYVNIEGNSRNGFVVRYYDNFNDAKVKNPIAIGVEYMTVEQLADHLQQRDFTAVAEPRHTEQKPKPKRNQPKKAEKPQQKEEQPSNQGQFGLVSDERMEELKKRLRAKLNNLNMGVDPEVLAIGLELTAGYIDRGVKKFADYSKEMIATLGDSVRPYLKAFYNGVRDMPEITGNGLDKDMDDYETVSKFNVATIGKEGEEAKPSIMETAEQVNNEQTVKQNAKKAGEGVDLQQYVGKSYRWLGERTAGKTTFTGVDKNGNLKYTVTTSYIGREHITRPETKTWTSSYTPIEAKAILAKITKDDVTEEQYQKALSDYEDWKKAEAAKEALLQEYVVKVAKALGMRKKKPTTGEVADAFQRASKEKQDEVRKILREYHKKLGTELSHDPTKPIFFIEGLGWSGIPENVKISEFSEDGSGEQIATSLDTNDRISFVHNVKSQFSQNDAVRVSVYDEHAETPEKIKNIIENEGEDGYDVDSNGTDSGFVDFETYKEAEDFAKHVDEIQKRVDEERDGRKYYSVVIGKNGRKSYRELTFSDSKDLTKAEWDKAVENGAPHDSEQTIKDKQEEQEYLWYADQYEIPDSLSSIDRIIERIGDKRPDNLRDWKRIRELIADRADRQKRLRKADRAMSAYLEGKIDSIDDDRLDRLDREDRQESSESQNEGNALVQAAQETGHLVIGSVPKTKTDTEGKVKYPVGGVYENEYDDVLTIKAIDGDKRLVSYDTPGKKDEWVSVGDLDDALIGKGLKKHDPRYSERGFTLRPATQEDLEQNRPIYVDGKKKFIVMLVRKGEQVSAAQMSKPYIEAVYTTENERVPFDKIEVEDIPSTIHLKSVGDFYEAYDNDAVALGMVTGVSIVTRKDGTRMAGFPKKMLDEYEQGLRNNGWDVSVDGKATKNATDKIRQQMQSAPTAKKNTDAIKNAMSGKTTGNDRKTTARGKKKNTSANAEVQQPSLFPTSENPEVEQPTLFSITESDEKGEEKPIETQPKDELSGESAEYQQRQIQERNLVIEIKNAIEDDAAYGKYDHKLTMSDIKKMAQKYDLLKDYKDTDLQELVERAMTLTTREVALADINKDDRTKKEGFDEVVRLYQSQPSLNARDSTRVANQQYSTPTPFGYVMDMFLMGGQKKPFKFLEPSAGNGALTIGIPAPLWHVNDIDERRLMNLRTMNYGTITNQDGTLPFEPKAYDAVATNPPFGSTDAKEFDGGKTTISSLEGLMAINALASMKDDGRAAIIIGGNTSYRDNGVMQSKDFKFFRHLYTHYNVVDVINLDGDMYKRNGTGYNVRMILIAGRKTDVPDNPTTFTIPPVKKKARAEQVKTFDELYQRVYDDIQSSYKTGSQSADTVRRDDSDGGQREAQRPSGNQAASGNAEQSVRGSETERRPQSGRAVRPTATQDTGSNGEQQQSGATGRLDNADGRNAGSTEHAEGDGRKQTTVRRGSGTTGRGNIGGTERNGTAQRPDTDGERPEVKDAAVQQPTEQTATQQGEQAPQGEQNAEQAPQEPKKVKVELGQEKVPYPNQSKSMTLTSQVPAAQAEAIQDNLEKLGDVDEMVRSELGYSSKDELFSHLAAEQIDSVALAINQMKQGKGFIIGDMTGVGKGRQGAALIRWAVRQGKTPIYFTQKARLFTDNYRDMCDIGSKGLRPFIIASNRDGQIVEQVLDKDGNRTYDKNGKIKTRVVHGIPSKEEYQRVYDYVRKNGKLPPEYDYVLVTYSQIQSGSDVYEIKNEKIEKKQKKGNITAADRNGDVRREVLETLAKNNYVLLDESHTVGGQSTSGLYMQEMLQGAAGVTYLSATFAKRPDNMPLYAMKTAMSESGLTQRELISAIAKGGVTLQEIMSKQLVQSGQMIRRERDFSGVTIDWEGVDEETDKKQRAQFDEVAKIFNAIREFQDTYVDPTIAAMSEALAEEGKYSERRAGTSHLGVNNVPFASKMYNLVNQLLFSLKADAVADRAIKALKEGKKPVISFSNTMEGFLDELPKNTPMEKLPDFSLTLMKALEGTLRYTEGDAGDRKNQFKKELSFKDLGEEAQEKYNEIRKTILNLSSGLPIDPMDAIKMRIEEAGYKVGEITGRNLEMVKDAAGNYVVRSRKERDSKATAYAFNNAEGDTGGLDVLLINKSGSTGISLHASSKFHSQKQRVMIAAQFQSDINDEVQMRGRIDRTGQVHRGQYVYIVSSIPAEQRLQMMFKNKLKSLDANTTSSQKSKFNEMEVTDFMNKYGDEVTWNYMSENQELEERLGDPLNMFSGKQGYVPGQKDDDDDEDTNAHPGSAAKILRRLPFLSVAEQERIFKEISDAYKVKIQLLNDAGENDLEITTMPLNAETKDKRIWHKGADPGSGNTFADNTYLETVEADVLRKPMKVAEMRKYSKQMLDGKNFEDWKAEQRQAIEDFYKDKEAKLRQKMDAAAEKKGDKAREKYVKDTMKARAQGKNKYTDEQINHLADIARKESIDQDHEKRDERVRSIQINEDIMLRTLDGFTPMQIYTIPNSNGHIVYATFLGYRPSKTYSIYSSTAVFATLDATRKMEVPFSEPELSHARKTGDDISLEKWDKAVPDTVRQTNYIITGNLMQALVDTSADHVRGHLISYTTKDGEVRQGILMNSWFTPELLGTSEPINTMLNQIKAGDAVESDDGEVKIEKNDNTRGWYKLSVPRSKAKGGKYFLDKKLLKYMADEEFTTKGGNMVGQFMEPNLKKVLDYLSKSLGVTVRKKANLKKTEELEREGDGTYSDEELSQINDPVAKWLGKSNRTKAQQRAFANRERKNMEAAVKRLAKTLHLDNVNIVMDASTLEGRKARAKGFYDRNTNEITIVIPNHRDVEDVMQTLLHEGVAHYGLRQLFGSHFDTFLDNVYAAADGDVRRRITDLAIRKYKGDFHVATEEYLASLAEDTDFENMPETFWHKIKRMFLAMLRDIGFEDFANTHAFTLSDNELRYILWRSYENLKEPGRFRSILGEAEDITTQERLGVGNYADEKMERDLRRAYNALDEAEYNYQQYEAKKEIDPFRYNPNMAASYKEQVDYWKDKIAELESKKTVDTDRLDRQDRGDREDRPEAAEKSSSEAESREDAVKRLTPRLLDTFKHWAKARKDYDEAFEKDPDGERTVELGDELNKWNDLMDAAKDVSMEHGIDLGELLRNNGMNGDMLEKYDDMFAGEPETWGKRDMMSRAEQVSHGIDPDLLFRDTIEDDDDTARDTYNAWADKATSRLREAWQDSMINVRNLQEAVLKQRGEKLEDYEDAYNAENRRHGKSRAESEYFTDNLYKPLLKSVNDAAKAAKVSVGDVTEYMMAKHGLERNIVFATRDADAAYKKAYDEAKAKYDALMNASKAEKDPKKADAYEKAANKVKFPDYDDVLAHFRLRDYAGLTALTGQSDTLDAENEAKKIVADMESRTDTTDLWKKVNDATKWTLQKAYESGIISKDNYNYVSGMFKNYIPLRGWQEDTAGDLFDYVGSGDKGTAFSPTLHKARGRKSEADNPIAYIGSMAVSAIVQGNKNKVKQTFLGFVENHPSNLVTVSEMWYRNYGTETDPDWREDVPNIPEDASADEIADIVKKHEEDMEKLKQLGKATKQRGRLHLGVPVKKGQALEHHVEVMVNGKKYVLYINGNPRAAQALNGTRQRRASQNSFESSKVAQMGRLLAERYTSLSPSFTVSNALRDITMAAITTLIKESPAYAFRFRANVAKLIGPVRMFSLMRWYKKYRQSGQNGLNGLSDTQKYFYEFMTEGAETGFTSLKEIDEYKKDMEKMYRNMNQKMLNPKRLFRGLSQGLEYANRCIEDMTRFAIYEASRQSGRSVKRSVTDAKNITLNFNRKGSGEMGNSTYRNLQIFVNPAIQSLQNVAKMAKEHPARFSLLTGSVALIGAAQVFATQLLWSVFGGGDGDDDNWNAVDEYWKLPSWQRRNNLVCWIPGTKKFAMVPLAQEFRVFHGFGETMTTVMEGKSGENPALEVLTQASDLLPLDFAGNNGNPLINMAPTVTQPLLQVGFNTDFTGRPLFKDNDYNKYEPSFQKAYVGTPSWLVKASELVNDATGGDDHKQGWWERTKVGNEVNNPAVVDHILKGYYGGLYSFLAQLGGTVFTLGTGNLPDAQEVPILNRVITAPRETEQGGKQKLPDWYYDLSEENARQQNEFNGYKKDYMKGDADGQEKFKQIVNSKDFQKWQTVNAYIGAVQQIRTAMSYTKDEKEKEELQKSLDEVLGQLDKMR